MKARRWILLLLLLSACAPLAAEPGHASSRQAPPDQRLTVFAAVSLTEFVEAAAAAFEASHPDVAVAVEVAGSQQLARQVREGAPADVFAPADQRWMDDLAAHGLVAGTPIAFAGNRIAVAVERGNPLGITSLADLQRPGTIVVMAAPAVPAGRYGARVLARAGVKLRPASLELDVRAALARVVMGEADAAIVYRSDIVTAQGAVDGIRVPEARTVPVRYSAAALTGAADPRLAHDFVAFLRDATGLRARYGLGAP